MLTTTSHNLDGFRLPAAPRPAIPLGGLSSRTTGLADGRCRNNLLRALSPRTLADLRPRLERVSLKRRQILHERGVPVFHAYFIERGMASMLSRAGDSAMLEIATLGCSDFVGMPLVLGTGRAPHRCVVQVPGEALRISAEELTRAMDELPELRVLLLGYVQAAIVQMAQLAVCNSRHPLQQRLARWLLVAQEQLGEHEIPLTHQNLSRSLGVRRAGITTALGQLEAAGLLRGGRGRLEILDRAGLEEQACICHRFIRVERQRITCEAVHVP